MATSHPHLQTSYVSGSSLRQEQVSGPSVLLQDSTLGNGLLTSASGGVLSLSPPWGKQ